LDLLINVRHKIFFAISVILISFFVISCAGEPEYTYEEYRKIKAIDNNGSSLSEEDGAVENGTGDEDGLQSYFDDLKDYNLYMEEFRALYSRYSAELISLIDDFGNETQDIEKKSQYAHLIKDIEEEWIIDLKEVKVPDFLMGYHDYFIGFLNNDVLYYKYFLEADLEKADDYSQKADEYYDKRLIELNALEKSFNERAESLGLELPFN
jgi:hypothetical protein